MLINRYEILLVRISWYLASFLTLRLNIVARVWPHRDQFQVYGLDLLLLSGLYGKTGNRLPSRYIRILRMVQPVFIFRSHTKQRRNRIPRNSNEAKQGRVSCFLHSITRKANSQYEDCILIRDI